MKLFFHVRVNIMRCVGVDLFSQSGIVARHSN